ncbi:MAG: hypothetical protein K8R48_00455 [Alphaproteobacteria bacterium]|nr:hypothetical protein [Alphaproteobacteria bacterium]
MADNLEQVKADLYKIFNKAVKDQPECDGYSYDAMVGNRKAISDLARAIAAVEKEQREAKERGINKLEKN